MKKFLKIPIEALSGLWLEPCSSFNKEYFEESWDCDYDNCEDCRKDFIEKYTVEEDDNKKREARKRT